MNLKPKRSSKSGNLFCPLDRVVQQLMIMNDVGTGCVIGAGAVVTKPIPDYSIAVGVPAKVIKKRRGDQ